MKDEKRRIFLADDHAVVREGLKALLNSQHDMQVVGEAADGLQAQQVLNECAAEVAVIDVSMPNVNGAELTAWITAHHPNVSVIALTVHEDRGYLLQLLKAGAAGYILKRAAADDLVRAIRNVSAGVPYVDPALTSYLLDGISRRGKTPAQSQRASLSERELEVGKFIAEGYSNKEIAARLDISVKTVETHKARLMAKLGFHSRAQLVRFALDAGWLTTA